MRGLIRNLILASAASATLLSVAPTAQADASSYLAYLASHNVNTGINPPARNVDAGLRMCDAMRHGETPDQIVSSVVLPIVDVRGMIDAAQHELCPDTLGR